MTPTPIPRTRPDRETWKHFVRAIRNFLTSEVRGRAIFLCGALLLIFLAINAMNVVNSYVGRDFMTSIEQRDTAGFVWKALLYVGGVRAPRRCAAVLFRFCEERLGLLWRQWLTRALVARLPRTRRPIRLREPGEIDNPDQRIADDVRTFTTTTLSFVLMVLNGSITIVAFSGVLWSISRTAVRRRRSAYAAIGSVVTMCSAAR